MFRTVSKFDLNHTHFQIAPSGVMSSTNAVLDLSTLNQLPRESPPLVPLIIPVWANFRPFIISYRVTQDPDTLQQVVSMITSRNSDLSNYHPSLAVVVTVEDAQIDFTDVTVSDPNDNTHT